MSTQPPPSPKPPGPGYPADVLAVALDHDPGSIPHVVARGKGHVAEQILTLAFANGVKVRQDADLAQVLSVLDLDSAIPPEAFAAVAEILAYLYQANHDAQQMTGAQQMTNEWVNAVPSPGGDKDPQATGTDPAQKRPCPAQKRP